MRYVLKVALLIVCLISCTHNEREIRRNLYRMMNSKVELDYRSLIPVSESSEQCDDDYIWLRYITRDYCKPCWLQELKEWDVFVKKYKGTNAVIVISVDNNEYAEVVNHIKKLDLHIFVFADFKGVFATRNDFIPVEGMYHTFMIDKSRRIKLIGNPLRNKEIGRIFEDSFIH